MAHGPKSKKRRAKKMRAIGRILSTVRWPHPRDRYLARMTQVFMVLGHNPRKYLERVFNV